MMSVFCILSLCSLLLRLVGVGLAYWMCRGLFVAIEIFDSLAFRVLCFHDCVCLLYSIFIFVALRLVGVGLAYCMCRGLFVAIEIFDSLAFHVLCFHGCVLIMGCCSVTLVPRP